MLSVIIIYLTTINTFSKSQSCQEMRDHLFKIKKRLLQRTEHISSSLPGQTEQAPYGWKIPTISLLLKKKKLIILIVGYAMSQFTKEFSGYIQIRTLATHVQNSSGVAVYTAPPAVRLLLIKHIQAKHHYTRSLPQAFELFQTSKCQDSIVELVKVLPTSPIHAYPTPLQTWGLDSLIQRISFLGATIGY